MASSVPLKAAARALPRTECNGLTDQPLTSRERLDVLCDPGTVNIIRSTVQSSRLGDGARDGDGVTGATGEIDGRPVACFAEDGSLTGGSLGDAHAATICAVLQLAARGNMPVIGFIESAGARIHEGTSALGAYARVFRAFIALSGKVPQISIATGTSAGGACYMAALTDIVVMTESASMFLTGPKVVREVTGELVSKEELGGCGVHGRNGVCQLLATDERDAALLTRELLSYLPQSASERPPRVAPRPPTGEDPAVGVPDRNAAAYDVRKVIRALVDAGTVLEIAPGWARNIVTGLARLDGRPVGIIANQARYLGGVIDSDASQKAASFIRTCDAFGVPLLVLVDTPGFMPGVRQESAGIIRHGATLLHAFAAANVPKVTLILRQAYGGGYIAMNSKDLGADFVFAWPRAAIGIMGPTSAVRIIHEAEIAASCDPNATLERLAETYAQEQQGARVAAREGAIDELITPIESRERLCRAFSTLTCQWPSQP